MTLKERFDRLTQEWEEHCEQNRFSSNMEDYLDHPAYRDLIKLGPPIIPWIMERYPNDSLPWGFVLQEITGVKMIQNRNHFSPSEVEKNWLEWWDKQQRNLPPAPVSDGTSAPAKTNP